MKRAICLIVVGLLLVMPCSQALAEHGGGHDRGHYSYRDAGTVVDSFSLSSKNLASSGHLYVTIDNVLYDKYGIL